MAKKASRKKTKTRKAADTQLARAEQLSKWMLNDLGGEELGMLCYLSDELRTPTGVRMMKKIIEDVAPRDPLERMLVEQMVWCHHRIRYLQWLPRSGILIALQLASHEHCEKAMASYRRGMLALKEYRATQRGMPLVAVQQVNQDNRQEVAVVAASIANKNVTNEVGANDGNGATNRSESGKPKALEGPQRRRSETPPRRRAKKPAMA